MVEWDQRIDLFNLSSSSCLPPTLFCLFPLLQQQAIAHVDKRENGTDKYC
jgi:hypothetical protein